jgi:hypothetical protein
VVDLEATMLTGRRKAIHRMQAARSGYCTCKHSVLGFNARKLGAQGRLVNASEDREMNICGLCSTLPREQPQCCMRKDYNERSFSAIREYMAENFCWEVWGISR